MVPTLSAVYFDGLTAHAQPVQLQLVNGCLHITGEGLARTLAVNDVSWPERTRHGKRVALLAQGGTVQCDDAQAWDAWWHANSKVSGAVIGQGSAWVVRIQQSWRLVALVSVLLCAVLAGAYRWGLPLAADTFVGLLPRSADAVLGQATLKSLDEQFLAPSELSQFQKDAVLEAWKAALAHTQTPQPEWQLVFRKGANFIGPNAFALPDGTMVMTDALVRMYEQRPDILVGVLGHELGHVQHRDGMRLVVQASLLSVVIGLAVGDASSFLALAPVVLGQAQYARQAEHAADVYSVQILQAAGISPSVMAEFFEDIHERRTDARAAASKKESAGNQDNDGAKDPASGGSQEKSAHDWLGIALASHPADAERIAFFRNAASNTP